VAEYFMSPASKNFGDLMPSLDFLLTKCRANPRDIEGLVVSVGPGSFTGLRVGISAAKGMAEALGTPLIGVSSLEALANQCPFVPHPVCPVLNSRKGEVFVALFDWHQNEGMVRKEHDTCVKLEELTSFVKETTLFVGTDYNRQAAGIKKFLGSRASLAPPPFWNIKASMVGALGLVRYRKGDFDEPENLVPFYMRPPDIRPNPFPPLSGKPTPD
jgi:tRNA threonylcarbamoyladenosine biosynthesis protein TsaB